MVGKLGVFLTLTAPGRKRHRRPDGQWCKCTPVDDVDGSRLAEWNATMGPRFNAFMKALSRKLGLDVVTYDAAGRRRRELGISYFKASEVQGRGALHVHVIVRRKDGRPLRLSRSRLRKWALAYGFGHSVDVSRVEPRHAGYVAKYVSKAAADRQVVPWRRQRWWIGPPGVRSHRRLVNVPYAFDDGRTVAKSWVDVETGETGPAVLADDWCPRYRTWSASRSWGELMRDVRASQQHYVLLMERLPSWELAQPRQAWALACPVRPDTGPA